MSTELINRITIKKDGVYLSSHSSNDTSPFHSWRCGGLSDIYAAEGQKGLDREVIRMLYEYAEVRGSHKSLERYRYAKDAPEAHAIYRRYSDQIDDRYESMGKRIKRVSGISLPKRQRNTEPMSVKCGTGCMGKSPQGAGNMTGNTKTGIWSDKEVQKGWLQSTS